MTALLTATSYGVQILQTLGALLIVCAMAFVILRFVARRGLVHMGSQRLKVEATLPLGQRQRIAIVRVDGREILVGITDREISLLSELPESIESDLYDLGAEPRDSFAERLAKKSA